MTKFKFVEHAKSEDAMLFGQRICDLDWLYLGQDIKLYDKRLKKDFMFKVYQVEVNQNYYVFAASEISDDEWLFYSQISD